MPKPEEELLTALGGVEVKEAAGPSPDPVKAGLVRPTGVSATNIFRHPDAHPIALDMLLLRQYGPEWMLWEGETLQHVVPVDFHTEALSDLNLAKLQACKTLHLVDTFWERWEVFGWCTAAFNAEFPDFEVMQVPSVAQALVAVDIANRIRDDVSFTDEVKAYVGAVFQHDGIFIPLPPADFATFESSDAPFDVEVAKARWPEVRAAGHAPAGETPLDEEFRRLLGAHSYLEESRERLRQQLRILGDV